MPDLTSPLSVVVIGRNQAAYLNSCFASIRRMHWLGDIEIIYIDTASSDNSLAKAETAGAVAIKIEPPRPSAAIARNVGWKIAQHPFVLFLDGDTIVDRSFAAKAIALFSQEEIAAVCGHRREKNPEASIYQSVLDLDWIYPVGEVDFFGGDVLIRKEALEKVKGYEGSLIAGEEPDLSRRLKGAGYKIVRLNIPMTLHDLGIHTFAQYWKRCFRTGYAYAAVSRRPADSGPPLWQRESVHNLWKGAILIAGTLAAVAAIPWSCWPLLGWAAAVGALVARSVVKALRKTASWKTALCYGVHAHLQHIPMLFGQLAYFRDSRRSLIEYR